MDEVISIPSKVAAPGSPPSEFPKSENLALDPEVVAKVQAVAKSNLIRWKSGVDQWWEDVGKKADEMFRAENKTSKTQNDDTEADLGNPCLRRIDHLANGGKAWRGTERPGIGSMHAYIAGNGLPPNKYRIR